jgi:hypothetical protein
MDRPLRLQEDEFDIISQQSAHEAGKIVSPTHRPTLPPPSQKILLVLISVRGEADLRAIVRSEFLRH